MKVEKKQTRNTLNSKLLYIFLLIYFLLFSRQLFTLNYFFNKNFIIKARRLFD